MTILHGVMGTKAWLPSGCRSTMSTRRGKEVGVRQRVTLMATSPSAMSILQRSSNLSNRASFMALTSP